VDRVLGQAHPQQTGCIRRASEQGHLHGVELIRRNCRNAVQERIVGDDAVARLVGWTHRIPDVPNPGELLAAGLLGAGETCVEQEPEKLRAAADMRKHLRRRPVLAVRRARDLFVGQWTRRLLEAAVRRPQCGLQLCVGAHGFLSFRIDCLAD
jgi:hypothetical protein